MIFIKINLLKGRGDKYQLVDCPEGISRPIEPKIEQYVTSSPNKDFYEIKIDKFLKQHENAIVKTATRKARVTFLRFDKKMQNLLLFITQLKYKWRRLILISHSKHLEIRTRKRADRAAASAKKALENLNKSLDKLPETLEVSYRRFNRVFEAAIAAKKVKIADNFLRISACLPAIEKLMYSEEEMEFWKLTTLNRLIIFTQESFSYLEQDFQEAIAAEARLRAKIKQAECQANKWKYLASIALQKGDEKLARKYLFIKNDCTEIALAIAAFLDTSNPWIQLSEKLAELKDQMTELGISTKNQFIS